MSALPDRISDRLNQLLEEAGSLALAPEISEKFAAYLSLLLRWNARTNLTAIRDEDGILRRHFVECILAARALPSGIATLLDLGSGAGFPGLPIALMRPEIAVTLAESQHKKAAFLREAARELGVSAHVHAARAEALTEQFDCVTLRAVDKMDEAIAAAIPLLAPAGTLALLTSTTAQTEIESSHPAFTWRLPIPLPQGIQRIFLLGQMQPKP